MVFSKDSELIISWFAIFKRVLFLFWKGGLLLSVFFPKQFFSSLIFLILWNIGSSLFFLEKKIGFLNSSSRISLFIN